MYFFKASHIFKLILYDDDILLTKASIYVLCNDIVSSTYYVSSRGRLINIYSKIFWKECNTKSEVQNVPRSYEKHHNSRPQKGDIM